jgi:hypothetical protein
VGGASAPSGRAADDDIHLIRETSRAAPALAAEAGS